MIPFYAAWRGNVASVMQTREIKFLSVELDYTQKRGKQQRTHKHDGRKELKRSGHLKGMVEQTEDITRKTP